MPTALSAAAIKLAIIIPVGINTVNAMIKSLLFLMCFFILFLSKRLVALSSYGVIILYAAYYVKGYLRYFINK